MELNTNVVGTIKFGNRLLPVHCSLDEPLFRATDVANMIDSCGSMWSIMQMCEEDEKLELPMVVAGLSRKVAFITETGLYNILAQSRAPSARKWRRVVFNDLIRMRKERDMDVVEQFDEWDHMLDDIYWDEERGMLMQSVTMPNGDVEQVPYKVER